ncbi:toll/interleukin-1 receptor domain-containing protein [Winogradskyella sp.]|uniref:toll/interleukin-1 receptor domain-containing protein n=1 Tax=Winogradskyella sp. TaxID=1883156 RepID=UPI00261C204B|nr:toll/interleukin-1 receptor domain-containing protein [Winogradskyella sp.]
MKIIIVYKEEIQKLIFNRFLSKNLKVKEIIFFKRDNFSDKEFIECIDPSVNLIILPLTLPNFYSLRIAEYIHLCNLQTETILLSNTPIQRPLLLKLFDNFQNASTMGFDLLNSIIENPKIDKHRQLNHNLIKKNIDRILKAGGTFCDAHGNPIYNINDYNKEPTTTTSQIKQKNNIYISYAWKDDKNVDREEIVDSLFDYLKSKNYNVKRDKMEIGYRGLISAFMKEIGKSMMIIIVLSDKYLKSTYCMFELFEIYRNSKFEKHLFTNKIFPIHLENIKLNDPKILESYYKYWEEKEKAWIDLIQKRVHQISKEQYIEYEKIKNITNNFGDLTSFIMDMNALTPNLLIENNFNKITSEIDNKIKNYS